MAAKGTFPLKLDCSLRGVTVALKLAACEWLLLFLLLLDGAFSYFITKFAQYCELQLPCLLCSRLDSVLGNEEHDFYKNLLCSDHRSEISSLVSCHNHDKLGDVHEMCEECVLSFARQESSQEMYKILVGKLGSDCLQKPLHGTDTVPCSMTTRFCSCCAKPWRCRPNVQKLVQSKPSPPVPKPDIPLPTSPARRALNRQEGLKKRKDRFSVSTTPFVLGYPDYDNLSHVGYTEVKISSDSESDILPSDDEDTTTVPRGRTDRKDSCLSQQDSKLINKQHVDFSSACLIHKSPHVEHVELEPERDETTTPNFLAFNGSVKHENASWQQIRKKANAAVSELTALEDIPLSTSIPEISAVLPPVKDDKVSHSTKFVSSGFHETVFHKNASPSMPLPLRLSEDKSVHTKENGDIEHMSAVNNWESIDLSSNTTLKGIVTDSVRKTTSLLANNYSASDLAPSNSKDIKPPDTLDRRDCNGIGSYEEPTTSKTYVAPQVDPSLCTKNQTMNGDADVLQMPDASSSSECPLPPSISMERSQSFGSFEGSLGEIEGENVVDKLRRQVEYDKKCINNLYKELEEERSAAAIAANQAMAMITKLQEEKSALHMEALQYLRMMEEQAEYDVDELERANDMLVEKEKEIQDLEAELDFFRIKYPEEFPEDTELNAEHMDMDMDTDKEDGPTLDIGNINFKES